MTNNLDLGAFYLFAIIFFWTPPHTWALALLVKKDYAQARVPMLPVVVGEKETLVPKEKGYYVVDHTARHVESVVAFP